MDNILITIGITCYREGDWLRECWESVLAQTDSRWEAVIIMDGGADEKTIEVFNSIEHPKLRKFEFEKNIGLNSAKNKGFELTRTLYHFVLDADDMLPANAVQMVLNTFEKHPEAACVYGDHEQFDDSGVIQSIEFPPRVDINNHEKIYYSGAAAYTVSSWKELGGFAISPELSRIGSDTDFHYGLLELSYYEIHCGGIFYRRRKGHASVSVQHKQRLHKVADEIVARHPIIFRNRRYRNRYLNNFYLESLIANYKAGNMKQCSALSWRLIKRGEAKKRYLWAIALYQYLPRFAKKAITDRLDSMWM